MYRLLKQYMGGYAISVVKIGIQINRNPIIRVFHKSCCTHRITANGEALICNDIISVINGNTKPTAGQIQEAVRICNVKCCRATVYCKRCRVEIGYRRVLCVIRQTNRNGIVVVHKLVRTVCIDIGVCDILDVRNGIGFFGIGSVRNCNRNINTVIVLTTLVDEEGGKSTADLIFRSVQLQGQNSVLIRIV